MNFTSAPRHKNIDRHSFVLVIGGGAVIDAIGYAAATAHRGISTDSNARPLYSGRNDAGIGVKNAGVIIADEKIIRAVLPRPMR
ncbi:MAG: hypothetical protein ACFHHU_03350 [Porticoccaceae bacterium]